MIKLLAFDLDGVLVCSKSTHYEALNRALVDFDETPISYEEHTSIYDGKPTRDKLKMRGISTSKHILINDKKQSYTIELLEKNLVTDSKLVDLFMRLKGEGFTIAVVSNSIRYTIQLVLFKLGVMRYVDYIVSNQDVETGKPHPEMYLKSMLYAKVGPRDTLIIEDSYVGRQAAFNSGAYLCAVRNPEEVSYELIKRSIDKANNIKPKWKGNSMNVLIPMAGAGSRFAVAGYTFPKPLIEVSGKPMIQVVVENLNIEGQYIYIVRKEHYEKYNMKYMLEMITPGCKIVQIDHLTEGAACTTLLAKDFIDNDEQLLIANSDQYIEWDSSDFMYSVQGEGIDGGIPVFTNAHPKWSYVNTDQDGFVTEVKEKVVISNKATVGIYHWKRGSDYVRYAEQMIKKGIRVNGEFYVCPVYTEAMEDGKKFKTYTVSEMWGLGTPEDLKYFLDNKK